MAPASHGRSRGAAVARRPPGPPPARAWRPGVALLAVGAGAAGAAPAGAVVGGERVDPAEHPAIVRLAEACTATLIAPRRLLTAGHCVPRVWPGVTLVRFGGASYVAARAARHPRFRYLAPGWPAEPYRDVGLVGLDRAVTGVRPLRPSRVRVPTGAAVVLVGYGTGRADRPRSYGVLRRAVLVVRSRRVCRRELERAGPQQGAQYRHRVMLCTQDPDGAPPYRSGCFGDSGAPILRRVRHAGAVRVVVVGVDSWGVACGDDEGDPEVFARASAEWAFVTARDPGWSTTRIAEPLAPGR